MMAVVLALSLLIATNSRATSQTTNTKPPLIGVTAIAFSAETQAVVDGMRDRLAKRGFRPGQTVNFEVHDAGADGTELSNVIRNFVELDVHMIVAITKPSIMAALESKNQIPIVTAGLTAKQAHEISNSHRRRPLTGVFEGDAREDQFSFIKALAPDIKTIAIPVDPDRGAFAEQIQELTTMARGHELKVIPLPISVRQNAVGAEMNALNPHSTAILLDRTLLPNAPIELIVAAAGTRKLRLFGIDADSVTRGALAAMVIDPRGIGQQLGDLVADVLEKPSAALRPFKRARASHVIFNEDGRAVLGFDAVEKALAGRRLSVIDWADDAGPGPRLKPAVPEAPPPLGVVRGISIPTPRAKPARP